MSDFVHAFLLLLPVLVVLAALTGWALMAVAWLQRRDTYRDRTAVARAVGVLDPHKAQARRAAATRAASPASQRRPAPWFADDLRDLPVEDATDLAGLRTVDDITRSAR